METPEEKLHRRTWWVGPAMLALAAFGLGLVVGHVIPRPGETRAEQLVVKRWLKTEQANVGLTHLLVECMANSERAP